MSGSSTESPDDLEQKMCFISHRWEDDHSGLDMAVHLSKRLTENGISVWLDVNFNRLADSIKSECHKRIAASKCFIALLSPEYAKSPYCVGELQMAESLDKPTLGITHIPCEVNELPAHFHGKLVLDISTAPKFDEAFPQILDKVKEVCGIKETGDINRDDCDTLALKPTRSWKPLVPPVLVGCVLVGMAIAWRQGGMDAPQRSIPPAEPSATTNRIAKTTVKIISPAHNGSASFRPDDVTGGGVVEVQGECSGITDEQTVVLVVLYKDAPYVQFQNKLIGPGPSGGWSSSIKVGNRNAPPQSGQKYVVKAFVLNRADWERTRNSFDQSWLEKAGSGQSPHDECSFILK